MYGLSFKVPICKVRKTQSGMCLNLPVVLLCQGASDPDSDPWHFRPWAAGGKILCAESLQTMFCSSWRNNIQETGSHCKSDYSVYFFNPFLLCQTKLWVTGKQFIPLWWKNASYGKTQRQSVLIIIYSNV